MEVEALPRKKLKILVLAVSSISIAGTISWNVREWQRNEEDAAAAHLISQLDQALSTYELDYASYPPGDASHLLRLLSTRRRKSPCPPESFEEQTQSNPPGTILSPVGKPIYYRSPGIHRPTKFDLWTEDSHGNPSGINNW